MYPIISKIQARLEGLFDVTIDENYGLAGFDPEGLLGLKADGFGECRLVGRSELNPEG